MAKRIKPKQRYLELSLILFIGILSIFIWDTFLIYPIKLFVVLTHEISHALAAIASGGTIHSIEISGNLGGSTATIEGNEIVIAAAGYLGSVVFGALLFISGYDKKLSYWVCFSFAGVFLLSAANLIVGATGEILAVFYSILLVVSPLYLPVILHKYLMKILGLISCLYAVIDIKEDLLTLEYRPSDAQLLANVTSIPAYVWGIVWLFVSIAVVFLLLRFSYKKGL